MNAKETSRKRSAEDAGHEADDAGRGGAQPDPGPMVDDSMPGGRPRRCCGTGGGVFAGEPKMSWRIRLRLGWDLGQRADQVKAEKRLNDEKPHLLIFRVPGAWRSLSLLSRLQHTKPDELAKLLEQGKRHLEFACSLAELQIGQGGRVLFEYPLAASEEPCLWKLRSIDVMRCVRCDQCQFGMTSVCPCGERATGVQGHGS